LLQERAVGAENRILVGLREIFYYITFACNLRCRHCYAGDNLSPRTHADFDLISTLLFRGYEAGARKVTFLGGEPTLHPDYEMILAVAAGLGYQRIVIYTNGIARPPLPKNRDFLDRLAVRFSFDGAGPETHDAVRGQGTFEGALGVFRRVAGEGIRAEVTFTLNAFNVSEIPQMVGRFVAGGASEINFHFVSLMGNAKKHRDLGLNPGAILRAQERLHLLKQQSPVPLRYPRLLVRRDELEGEVARGCGCHIFRPERLLIFPQGEMRRCPLEITPGLVGRPAVEEVAHFSGCPLAERLLPGGVPDGYVVTCISWKDH
jgi:MoaA/NifB/PqqE/SkfB family radical SAM enzyme